MEWWKTIAPLVGVILGSFGTLLAQKFSDGRALRRDRFLAEQEAKARYRAEWVTLRRETYMDLQRALEVYANIRRVPRTTRLSDEARREGMASTIQMHALLARLEDRQLASDAREWTDRTFENDAAMSAALRPIQERLGDHLRALYANEPD
ncbi:hypothetical protein [Streptomyces sp. NBC_00078]|uniref:hypothetical protein n=1 Tax=unclassified Streptomyces TaxID=2593676 RepID=UPI00225050A4|nr:hypothetical protein [Streptomyces sp. NBC_00078]MCX5419940.1 hypothetical protein [Streptomyces sp. NBC_00078]